MKTATLLKLNAYGARWHVRRDYNPSAMDRPTRDPIIASFQTKRACKEFCKRHNIQIREVRP